MFEDDGCLYLLILTRAPNNPFIQINRINFQPCQTSRVPCFCLQSELVGFTGIVEARSVRVFTLFDESR